MVKLIVSTNKTKCRKCRYQTPKIEYKKGPDPDNFYLELNKLMCAACGYVYFGELKEGKKTEFKMSEKSYNKMLKRHEKFHNNPYHFLEE